MLRCNLIYDGIIHFTVHDWAVGLHYNGMLAAKRDDGPLLAEWMYLDLIDGWHLEACIFNLLEVFQAAGLS